MAACKFGLCPLTPVFNGSIHIGCSPNAELAVLLNTECQAILPASGCENFWADVDITSLDGLQYIEYENFMVTQITGATGTQTCPYDQNAKGGSFDCSYYGTGTGSGSLTQGELKLVTQSIEVKLKCSDLFTSETGTLYNGSFTCTTDNPTTTATYRFCAGNCESKPEVGVITYLQIPKSKDVTLHAGDLKCEFDPKEDPVSAFLDAFVPLFTKQITEALKEPVKETLNDLIPDLPFPESCSSESSSRMRYVKKNLS